MKTRDGPAAFIDSLYEATLVPESWVGVLERLADELGGTSAWLSRLDIVDGTGSGLLARLDPAWAQAYQAHYHRVNPFSNVGEPQAYIRGWRPIVLTDEHNVGRERLVRTEYFNDFMRPQGVHGVMIIRLALVGNTVAAANINRSDAKAVFTRAELSQAARLQRHLIRAYDITTKLASAHAVGTELSEAIQVLPHAMFILDRRGIVRRANRAAEVLLRDRIELQITSGRLTAADPVIAGCLEARITAAGSNDQETRRGASFSAPAADGAAPLSITVSPLRAEREDVFGLGPSVLVCVGDSSAVNIVSVGKLMQLFGLTRAEARVAAAVHAGKRTREIAEALRISPNTVRVHLGRVFVKTGASRQADLTRILSVTLPG